MQQKSEGISLGKRINVSQGFEALCCRGTLNGTGCPRFPSVSLNIAWLRGSHGAALPTAIMWVAFLIYMYMCVYTHRCTQAYICTYMYMCVCVYMYYVSPFKVRRQELEGSGMGSRDANGKHGAGYRPTQETPTPRPWLFSTRPEHQRAGLALPRTTGRLPKPPGV